MTDAWVVIAASTEVGAGEAMPIDIGDLELVLWRGHDGVPCVMAARCPHLWSHLGVEGVVDGTELVCAAHFWRFARDGTGTKLSETGRRDWKSDVEAFDVREQDGAISALLRGAPET